jgi:PAS domain S-box-containing protein
VTLRLTPARFALSYIVLGVVALALLAVPLWYGFQANLGTFRSYIPAAEMQRFVDIFHRDGPRAVTAAVDAYAMTLPPDQVALFVDAQKQRLAGNLPHWPAGVPDVPGTYGLVIERGSNAPTRVIVSHVGLPDGYVLLMGRESVIFDSLVVRFWFGIAGAIAILLSLGLLFGWLLRRAHGQLEGLVAQRTAALQLSEQRNSLAMEASEEGHFDIKYDTKEQFYSDRLLELVGIPTGTHFSSRAEAIKVLRFFGASDAELYLATIRSVEATNGPSRYEFEFRIVLPSGEMRWLRTRGKITRDAEGNIQRRTGVAADITEAKLAAEALRASEERHSLALEATEEGHFDVNVDTDEIFTSERLNEIYDFPTGTRVLKRSEYLKDSRLYGDDAEIFPAGIRAAEAKGGPERYEFEYRILRLSGEMRWLRTRGKVTRDAEGRARRRTGMVADITEAKLAAEALRASEERYSLAMEASEEGHFDWNVRTDDIFVSAHMKKVFGFPLDAEFRTRNDLIARIPYHPDDALWLPSMARDTLAGRALAHEFEYRIMRGNEIRWLQARWKIFRDAAGAAQRVVGVVTDETERKRAQEELKAMERNLRQAQRLEAMGTLAGGIAHDFNNILGAILGFGEMAMRDAAKGSRLWRDLDCIMEAGERGRALVDRVLAFSRSSVGGRVPVHVEKVVREALDQLSAKLPPDITLHAKLHAGRAAMQGDATQVHQLVMNLATNAIQAMTAGGTLRVSLRVERIEQTRAPTIGALSPAEYLVLQVADTGIGIPADVLERMFDPFFTTKEVGTGTGLGLSIVHGVVTEIGGAIDVATTVGTGTTFTIYLPRAGDAAETNPAETLSLPRGDGQRVLVVDDEEPLVRLATRTLEELGYVPVGFTSSRAALAAFRADPQRFDAVVADERMPGMSGSALIREVRGIRDRIPVVLMSGYVGDAVALQARDAGAEEVLRKPLSARDLATSLARVLYT